MSRRGIVLVSHQILLYPVRSLDMPLYHQIQIIKPIGFHDTCVLHIQVFYCAGLKNLVKMFRQQFATTQSWLLGLQPTPRHV